MNIAIWRGDAARPFEPPASRAAAGTAGRAEGAAPRRGGTACQFLPQWISLRLAWLASRSVSLPQDGNPEPVPFEWSDSNTRARLLTSSVSL